MSKNLGEVAGGAVGGLGGKTEELKNNVPNPLDAVNDKASGAKDAASGAAGSVKYTAENTGSSAHHNIEENTPAVPNKDAVLSGVGPHVYDVAHQG